MVNKLAKKKATTKTKAISAKSFIIGHRYLITWKNFNKEVISRGSVVSGGSAKMICFKDDKLNAVTIIPLTFIISHKSI
jgi:hypothetical protein